MNFREIRAEDGQWARPLLEAGGFQSCEFNFTDIFMWKQVNRTKIAQFEGFVMVRSQDDTPRLYYLYPVGGTDRKAALRAIIRDAMEAGKQPVIFSIPENEVAGIKAMFPHVFDFTNPRSQSDYIYAAGDLADLPGKKFQKKRNHCSRFERSYPDWQFHPLAAESLDEVLAFNTRWCHLYDNRDDAGIAREHGAIELACRHFDELGLKGGYITVEGEIVAFSFGSPLGPDTFVTHVEKALYDVNGAYNIINREMARHFGGPYEWINREDDVGEDGLREAKLSYHPAYLVDKYRAVPRVWPPEAEL